MVNIDAIRHKIDYSRSE